MPFHTPRILLVAWENWCCCIFFINSGPNLQQGQISIVQWMPSEYQAAFALVHLLTCLCQYGISPDLHATLASKHAIMISCSYLATDFIFSLINPLLRDLGLLAVNGFNLVAGLGKTNCYSISFYCLRIWLRPGIEISIGVFKKIIFFKKITMVEKSLCQVARGAIREWQLSQ